jgi:NADPH:quinone reductase-like Zn-dependent oxidoreductase
MATTATEHATMKAVVHNAFGSSRVLEIDEIEKPAAGGGDVLVRVHAASLNRADWYAMTGTPYVGRAQMGVRRPKSPMLSTDFAGTVEAIGKDVTQFLAGDTVFGRSDAFAEYVRVPEDGALAAKPAGVTFEEAACAGVAGVTALQGVRDHGQVRPGHKVLVNGASGGVGTFAVQIAKALGAEVTAVCSTGNVELQRSIGADHVVDYTREDFTRSDRRYDLMIDVAGSRSWRECRRVLEPDATIVLIGGPKTNRVLGPLTHMMMVKIGAAARSQKAVFFIAKLNGPDLAALGELLESGKVTPVIDRRYELGEIRDAFRHLGEGHARGKIVVTL